MSTFQVPVSLYMSAPVVTVGTASTLDDARKLMAERNVSALPVVGPEGALAGILRRSDLLRVGRAGSGRRPGDANLSLPPALVSDEMSDDVPTVRPEAPLVEAAQRMVRDRTHRVVVVEGGVPVGILTTRDLMRALEEKRANHPVADFMSHPVFTIRADEPVALAVERLARARVTGLVVVEDGWPVGLFTEVEALESAELPRHTPVEEAMSPRLLALQPTTRLHRAAAQAAATRVRRVVVHDDGKLAGILTGLDFARAVAG
jgi:CBS domain-containing protein